MRRWFGIGIASLAAVTMTIVLNVSFLAGFPWSEHLFR
jgi:hypothetical protein